MKYKKGTYFLIKENGYYPEKVGQIGVLTGYGYTDLPLVEFDNNGHSLTFDHDCMEILPEELQNEPIEVIKLWAAL